MAAKQKATTTPTPPPKRGRKPVAPKVHYTPNPEQLECPWLRQAWDTNVNWAVFSIYLTMNQRNVAAAYRQYALQNNLSPNTSGGIVNASRGLHPTKAMRLTMTDSKGKSIPIPTWPERAVAYDNDLAKKLMEQVQSQQLIYAAKAQAHLHTNTMIILDKLKAAIQQHVPTGEKIGELMTAHAKAAELIGQLYQPHIADGETGKVVSAEQQVTSVAKKIGRIADILAQAKERAEE